MTTDDLIEILRQHPGKIVLLTDRDFSERLPVRFVKVEVNHKMKKQFFDSNMYVESEDFRDRYLGHYSAEQLSEMFEPAEEAVVIE